MKRKRGSRGGLKKGKKNDRHMVDNRQTLPLSLEGEDSIDQTHEPRVNIELDVKQPSARDNQMAKASVNDVDVSHIKSSTKVGHSRVKVKLKSSRLLESYQSSPDVQTLSGHAPSDTDKSNPQLVMEVNEATNGKEDAMYLSDGQTLQSMVPENLKRKPGSIKIKSSRCLGLSGDFIKQKGDQGIPAERSITISDDEKKLNISYPSSLLQIDPKLQRKLPQKGSSCNKKELSAALSVISKVMKMDAAEPFNAPVNPVALGIPDYFDIIDTPMDFGTICHNLELGIKYKKSEDVYRDVQFIWDNCYKYNNKGDYILDLMKRVKKNFMKYWAAAGLHTDMSSAATASTQVEDDVRHNQDKSNSKAKSKQKRRRHGIDKHKSNCLCAVCVVRRRRKEREECAVFKSQMMVNNASSFGEPKLEGSSPADNNGSEDAASSLYHSHNTGGQLDEEGAKVETAETLQLTGSEELQKPDAKGVEMELCPKASNDEACLEMSDEDGALHESDQHLCDQEVHQTNSTQHSGKKDGDDDDIRVSSQPGQELKLAENPPLQENKSVLWLCSSLFPGTQRSVWNGPHSLSRRHPLAHAHNPILGAISTIAKT
ncbi:Transcription factor GTE6 [Apostasia shenzhenica]|uniref:Transcription factor GTE6 n=1 Tax=Apostasia shenzhenica TaxID=1088818 RepID=A0A2I0AUX7_9ASPA|nr:Transcription factor GTE6 [Apostasia shenzhenica]